MLLVVGWLIVLFLVLFQKIRAVYESNPSKFKTLQNILEVEKEMYGPAWPKAGATLALMWLKRCVCLPAWRPGSFLCLFVVIFSKLQQHELENAIRCDQSVCLQV